MAALAGLNGLLVLRQAIGRGRNIQWGWVGVATWLLLVIGLAYWRARAYYGYIALVPWLGFIVLPSLLLRISLALVSRWQLAPAMWFRTVAVLLHPFDGWPLLRRLARAAAYIHQDRFAAARAEYETVAGHPSRFAISAQAALLVLDCHWHGLVEWVHATMDGRDLAAHPDIAALYLRSLGESGDTPVLLYDAHDYLLPEIDAPTFTLHRWWIDLTTMAFAGRLPAVQALLAGPLRHMPPTQKNSWLATTHAALGDLPAAKALLEPQLVESTVPERRLAAIQRLEVPPFPAANLDEQARFYLQEIERDLVRRLADDGYLGPKRAKPWVTMILIAANLIMFGIEICAGGSENDDVIYKLGAMLPPDDIHCRLWRVLAANFLHFGWLHITMNMLGLWLLGPFVERRTGWWRYLFIYMLSGLYAVGGCWLLQYFHVPLYHYLHVLIEPSPLVGASGAIMGLIGATGAIELRRYLKDRAVHNRQRFSRVVFIVILQTAFDQVSKQISSSAHLIGCAAGFLITLLIWREYVEPEIPKLPAPLPPVAEPVKL